MRGYLSLPDGLDCCLLQGGLENSRAKGDMESKRPVRVMGEELGKGRACRGEYEHSHPTGD